MKKNNSSHEKVNLFFSAFLIIAYVICGYFFVSFANTQGPVVRNIVLSAVFAVFGLLVFYATRVGEKKIVKRFSIATLIILDIPSLLIILAFCIEGFPFHELVAGAAGDSVQGIVAFMAAVALGYGIPYTFISGFETVSEEELNKADEEKEEEEEVLEGGIEADLKDAEAEAENDTETPAEEVETDEVVVEGTAE